MPDIKTNSSNLGNNTALNQIIHRLAMPNGFAKLTPQQRRLLLGAVLSSIVPADGQIRKVEMEHLENYLTNKFQFAKEQLSETLAMARQTQPFGNIEKLASHLPDLLSIEDRIQLIGMLWDLALCDQELHPNEKTLIYKIADAAGVLRKRVTEQEAIAASRNGIGT